MNLVIINTILCIAILIFGLIKYNKEKNSLALLLALAFGIFALSHLATLFGIANSIKSILIIIRIIAYLLVLAAIIKND